MAMARVRARARARARARVLAQACMPPWKVSASCSRW
jgi:hypothetical protein